MAVVFVGRGNLSAEILSVEYLCALIFLVGRNQLRENFVRPFYAHFNDFVIIAMETECSRKMKNAQNGHFWTFWSTWAKGRKVAPPHLGPWGGPTLRRMS